MLDCQQVSELAEDVVRTAGAGGYLERIVTEPTTDSLGQEALRVTLVVRPEAVRMLTGDQTINVLVGIQRGFEIAGDERFPIVEYATEQDLADEDDDGGTSGDD